MESIESFDELEVNTIDGVNIAMPVRTTDGIVEMLTGVAPKGAYLMVNIYVYGSVKGANESYEHNYKNLGKDYGIMTSGGSNSDRYFVTYKNQLRLSGDALYLLTDQYVTYVYFQKRNMIIKLMETKRDDTDSKINDYIKLLSDKLSELE